MTEIMADKVSKFSFQHLGGKKFPSIESKETQESLLKWSMKNRIKAQTFCFDQPFQSYQKDDFVLAFFQDLNVISSLQVLSDSGKWCQLGIKADSVTADQLSCSVLSMSLFDRLTEHHIVRETGQIHKCLDEFYEDFNISDELRKMLLLEDSDNYDIYTDGERDEFLFRLFKHLTLGGSVCQYEDNIQPYLDLTKMLYKDLVTVQKDTSTGDLHISSIVLKVSALGSGGRFYPSDKENEQNFAYMVVDPLKRHVTVLYHRFGAAVFD